MKTVLIALVLACFFVSSGCDVGINPLLFDGSPVEASILLNTTGSSFAGSYEADLTEILKDISKDFDSVNVFNITLQIENTGSMDPATTLAGAAAFNDSMIVNFSNKPLSSLLTEQSIFRIPGFTIHKSGVLYLKQRINFALANPDSLTHARFSVAGSSSNHPVDLTAKFKVYTQVFTKK